MLVILKKAYLLSVKFLLLNLKKMLSQAKKIPQGIRANPIYLPAPDEVVSALYTSFKTDPQRPNEQWLHEIPRHNVVAVCGAHLSNMPLNHQLLDRNAIFRCVIYIGQLSILVALMILARHIFISY